MEWYAPAPLQWEVQHKSSGEDTWTDSAVSTHFTVARVNRGVIEIAHSVSGPGSYDFRIRTKTPATSRQGQVLHSSWSEITVRVNSAPDFSSDTATTISVWESAQRGSYIHSRPTTATDKDGDTLTYSLSGADASSFAIDASTGWITVNSSLDYETKKSYSITVVANDGKGGSGSIEVTISVLDVNEDPQFSSDTTTRLIAEQLAPGANVGDPVTATDPDGDTLAYSLSGADAASFSIDASTGQITANSSLDYETKNRYSVTVTAVADGGGSDTIQVEIIVTNELPPLPNLKQVELPESYSRLDNVAVQWDFPVEFNWDYHRFTGQYKRTGKRYTDWTDIHNIREIRDADDTASTPSVVRVRIKLPRDASYDVRMRITNLLDDTAHGPWTEITTNRPPQFPSLDTDTIRSVVENSPAGANAGLPVKAVNPDGDTLTYSLSGTDESSFSIDASTGQITANSSLDYETKNSYSVTVSADDGRGGTDTTKVAISVTDVNEAPQFPLDKTSRSVPENSPLGTYVGKPVTATDQDGDTIAYSLSGADESSFSIDASTGQITANSSLDYETKNSYSVTVSADDGNGGTDTTKVAISVTDVNDIPALAGMRQGELPQSHSSKEYVALELALPDGLAASGYSIEIQSKDPCEIKWKTSKPLLDYGSLSTTSGVVKIAHSLPRPGTYFFRARLVGAGDARSPWIETITKPPADTTSGVGPTARISGPKDAVTGPFRLKVTFSESVTGLEASEIVSNDISAGHIYAISGSGSEYTFGVTPGRGGELRFQLPAGAAQDGCGNYNLATQPFTVQANLDRPTVKMYRYEPAPVVGPFNLFISFSEDVTLHDNFAPRNVLTRSNDSRLTDLNLPNEYDYLLDMERIKITNGQAIKLYKRHVGGPYAERTDKHYVLAVVPLGDGPVTVELLDWAGYIIQGRSDELVYARGSEPARFSVEADLYRPVPTITGPEGPVTGPFDVTVTFNKPVKLLQQIGGVSRYRYYYDPLRIGNGKVVKTNNEAVGTRSVTVTIKPTSSGPVTVDLPAGAFSAYEARYSGVSVLEGTDKDPFDPSVHRVVWGPVPTGFVPYTELNKGNFAADTFTVQADLD